MNRLRLDFRLVYIHLAHGIALNRRDRITDNYLQQFAQNF